MATLAKCLDEAGIDPAEQKLMKAKALKLGKDGYATPEANRKVIKDAIKELNAEWDSVAGQVEKATGGVFQGRGEAVAVKERESAKIVKKLKQNSEYENLFKQLLNKND